MASAIDRTDSTDGRFAEHVGRDERPRREQTPIEILDAKCPELSGRKRPESRNDLRRVPRGLQHRSRREKRRELRMQRQARANAEGQGAGDPLRLRRPSPHSAITECRADWHAPPRLTLHRRVLGSKCRGEAQQGTAPRTQDPIGLAPKRDHDAKRNV